MVMFSKRPPTGRSVVLTCRQSVELPATCAKGSDIAFCQTSRLQTSISDAKFSNLQSAGSNTV